MSRNNDVVMDLSVLDGLVKSLGKDTYVKVGVLGDKTTRDDGGNLTNAAIGVIQEFGSVTNNIPARSFLRMPLESHAEQILSFVGSKKVSSLLLAGKPAEALKLVGLYAEAWVHSAFASRGFGSWAPNAPLTVRRKKSSAPLIDTRQLERSISSEVVIP
jgi:hypothetical protein